MFNHCSNDRWLWKWQRPFCMWSLQTHTVNVTWTCVNASLPTRRGSTFYERKSGHSTEQLVYGVRTQFACTILLLYNNPAARLSSSCRSRLVPFLPGTVSRRISISYSDLCAVPLSRSGWTFPDVYCIYLQVEIHITSIVQTNHWNLVTKIENNQQKRTARLTEVYGRLALFGVCFNASVHWAKMTFFTLLAPPT